MTEDRSAVARQCAAVAVGSVRVSRHVVGAGAAAAEAADDVVAAVVACRSRCCWWCW